MGKFLVLAAAGLAIVGFVHFKGDEIPIPENFLALEEKRCVENTTGLSQEMTARYCACVGEGIAAGFSFKDYLLVGSDMADNLGAANLKAEAGLRLEEVGARCRRSIGR